MTSDKISDEDWDWIQAIAAQVANAAISDDNVAQENAVAEMRCALGKLKIKYGRLPSIIATEADYEENPSVKEKLLLKALAAAEAISDSTNVQLITHSLAELYIDIIRDREKAAHWTARFESLIDGDRGRSELTNLFTGLAQLSENAGNDDLSVKQP